MNQNTDHLKHLLAVLFSTFPAPPGAATPDGFQRAMEAYAVALDDYDAGDVQEGLRRIIAGEWPEHDGRYAPTAPQIARAVKQAAADRGQSDQRQASVVQQLTHRERDEEFQASKTPESRARVKAMADKLIADLAQQSLTDDAKAAHRKREAWAKVNARFAPKDEAEHIRRLGYSVGDPDGDSDAA